MTTRTVTDAGGREWTCVANASIEAMGKDVVLSCTTPSVTDPVLVTVGWQWESIAPNGLARMITLASPPPRA
jgi:hypothetical protein